MTTDPKSAATPSPVLAHYAAGIEEHRLEHGPGQLERARTREILERHLPAPPARIADVGGGPGAYAIWLAERGHDVHLLDIVPLHVEQAAQAFHQKGLTRARADWGDARVLPFRDES